MIFFRPRNLAYVFLASAGLGALALIDPTGVLRAIIGASALFLPVIVLLVPSLLPAYGLAAAATVAGGASLGVLIVTGIVLNLTPPGLSQVTWLPLAVAALAIAATVTRHTAVPPARIALASHEGWMFGVAIALVVVAFVFARDFADLPGQSFTQLWILPAGSDASAVSIGIHSSEDRPVAYRLQLLEDGRAVRSWSVSSLQPGQTWKTTVATSPGRLEARLYRGDDPGDVYRHVTINLPAVAGAASR